MKTPEFFNREETLFNLTLGLRALVLAIIRHAVERRGGTVSADPFKFKLGCKGIPMAERDACLQEVEHLFTSLTTTTVFHLRDVQQNISLS